VRQNLEIAPTAPAPAARVRRRVDEALERRARDVRRRQARALSGGFATAMVARALVPPALH
jgi:hypothetical protein